MSAVLARNPAVVEPRFLPSGPPRAVLIGLTPSMRAALAPSLRSAGFDVLESASVEEHDCRAAVVVVEADHDPRLITAVRAACRSTGDAFIVGVVGWWSDHEPEVRRLADAVLHVPLRAPQVRAVIDALPVRAEGGGLPASTRN